MSKFLSAAIDLHLMARSILNKFLNDDYDKLLSFLNGRLSRALSLWSRDELSNPGIKKKLVEKILLQALTNSP